MNFCDRLFASEMSRAQHEIDAHGLNKQSTIKTVKGNLKAPSKSKKQRRLPKTKKAVKKAKKVVKKKRNIKALTRTNTNTDVNNNNVTTKSSAPNIPLVPHQPSYIDKENELSLREQASHINRNPFSVVNHQHRNNSH